MNPITQKQIEFAMIDGTAHIAAVAEPASRELITISWLTLERFTH
jgi:hypothetical protein